MTEQETRLARYWGLIRLGHALIGLGVLGLAVVVVGRAGDAWTWAFAGLVASAMVSWLLAREAYYQEVRRLRFERFRREQCRPIA